MNGEEEVDSYLRNVTGHCEKQMAVFDIKGSSEEEDVLSDKIGSLQSSPD